MLTPLCGMGDSVTRNRTIAVLDRKAGRCLRLFRTVGLTLKNNNLVLIVATDKVVHEGNFFNVRLVPFLRMATDSRSE